MDNVALARRVYSGFEAYRERRAADVSAGREDGDFQPFFDLLADDVVLEYGVSEGTPISGEHRGKATVIHFARVIGPELVEDAWLEGPVEYIDGGDRVVVLLRESYKIRKTGVTARDKAACVVLDFHDGLIARALFIKDMTELVDACRIKESAEPNIL